MGGYGTVTGQRRFGEPPAFPAWVHSIERRGRVGVVSIEEVPMARARRVPPRTATLSPSIGGDVLRLAGVTGQTALRDARDVGAQLLLMARQTLRGAQAASLAIAHDVVDVARRAADGVAGGVREIREDLTRPRRMPRKPAAKAAARGRTRAR